MSEVESGEMLEGANACPTKDPLVSRIRNTGSNVRNRIRKFNVIKISA